MDISKQEILDRAISLVPGDEHNDPAVDGDVIAQIVFPHALRRAYRWFYESGMGDLNDAVREVQITGFAAGKADIPEEIIKSALKTASFPGRTLVSYLPYQDYQGFRFSKQLDYFSVMGDQIYFVEANTALTDFAETLTMETVAMPLIEPNAFQFDMPRAAIEKTVEIISKFMRGELSLDSIN